jgi:hypothetical protein
MFPEDKAPVSSSYENHVVLPRQDSTFPLGKAFALCEWPLRGRIALQFDVFQLQPFALSTGALLPTQARSDLSEGFQPLKTQDLV